jgi:hypothetical protein
MPCGRIFCHHFSVSGKRKNKNPDARYVFKIRLLLGEKLA